MPHCYSKYCFVPGCTNTSKLNPGKEFLSVPVNPELRLKWMKASGRDLEKNPVSPKAHFYCCEDHFDLEKDLKNWMKFRFYRQSGHRTIAKLKQGVVPHKFNCQKEESLVKEVIRKRASVKEKKLIEMMRNRRQESSETDTLSEPSVCEVEIHFEPKTTEKKHVSFKDELRSQVRSVGVQAEVKANDSQGTVHLTSASRTSSDNEPTTIITAGGMKWVRTTVPIYS